MKFTDLLIIYFAAGAPFGVYQITTVRQSKNIKAWLKIFLRICLWPVYAVLALADWSSEIRLSDESDLDRHIDSIRIEMEGLVFANDPISSIFDFREILQRYAGLSEAANVSADVKSSNDIFALSGSDNNDLASACLTRKNQRKLSFHQSLARSEFVDMISEIAGIEPGRIRILELAVELANCVSDPLTAGIIMTLMSKPQPGQNIQAQSPLSEISLAKSRSAS